jgi:hypothetical protein
VKITIAEIIVSLVTKITEREEGNTMKSVRREIALISIQDILFDKFVSTQQHVENNKI